MLAAFLFFFSQRGEVNVFASTQAATSLYSHRSLYDAVLSPLHVANCQNGILLHPQLLPDFHSVHAPRPKAATITLKSNTPVIFSWAPLFDSSSIIAVSYREVHWAAVALAQLTLCQPPEWHRLLCASHILIQVSMLVSLLLSRASCCIAGELVNQTDLGEYWWNWSFCCSCGRCCCKCLFLFHMF